MSSGTIVSKSFLTCFREGKNLQREQILPTAALNQRAVFKEDGLRYYHLIATHASYETASLVQHVATIALMPLAPFMELYHCECGKIKLSSCFKNIVLIPLEEARAAAEILCSLFRIVYKTALISSMIFGLVTWHIGEASVNLVTGSRYTILSADPKVRDSVYHALGMAFLLGPPMALLPTPFMRAIPAVIIAISMTLRGK